MVWMVGTIMERTERSGRGAWATVIDRLRCCLNHAFVARKPRVQYAGAIYHIMNRGNGKAAVFRNGQDHLSFLKTLGEACAKTGWQIHAYCLMKTHFHLVVETPRANLVPGM